jgi:hypothetical protein
VCPPVDEEVSGFSQGIRRPKASDVLTLLGTPIVVRKLKNKTALLNALTRGALSIPHPVFE